MARTRFDDSLIYWRVLPIGLATAFASGVMMSLASRVLVVKMDDIGVKETALNALIFGGAGLLVGAILWLPLSLLWHVVAIRLRDRIGLYRAAMWTSAAFCLWICGSLLLLSLDWSFAASRTNSIKLLWSIGTCIVAMAMTHWGFRPAQAKGKNT